MSNNQNKTPTVCSFCGRSDSEVDRLIAGNGVFICDECIEVCHSLLLDSDYDIQPRKGKSKQPPKDFVLPTPKELKARLDEYVIGQEDAKRTLSVAVYNQYKRIFYAEKTDVEFYPVNLPDFCFQTVLLFRLPGSAPGYLRYPHPEPVFCKGYFP